MLHTPSEDSRLECPRAIHSHLLCSLCHHSCSHDGVQVFSEPTVEATSYVRDRMRVLCHRGGPHCGGSADEQRTPVAAVHVRQGDSCDRHSETAGPFNSMFAWDATKGELPSTCPSTLLLTLTLLP